ncbi:MAG: CDP-alcohol phosphatidyltransferase family protein [Candidatus Puniceispirillales bacterium]
MSVSEPKVSNQKHKTRQKAAAWAVHSFTTSGIVLGFLGLVAVFEGKQELAFIFMGLALLVDGVDGTLARLAKVTQVTPQVDGASLDNVVDMFNYSVLPALMIYWFEMVPEQFSIPAAAAIMAVSCYTFADTSMKTDDYYFKGFAAFWNLLVLFFFLLETSQLTNLIIISICCILTFAPIKIIHPLRVKAWRSITIPMAVLWGATAFRLIHERTQTNEAGTISSLIFWLWIASSLYFFSISFIRTISKRN